MNWAALNLGADPCVQHNPSVWDLRRSQYKAAGIPTGPWMHCHSMADIEFVVKTGYAWEAPFIGVNIEDVVSDKLDLAAVGEYLIREWPQPVHMPSLPWLQNGQGWQHVAFAYIALELFPEVPGQQPYLDGWQRCVDHAFAEGAQHVTLLYSTQSPRSVYPNVAHCLYTADNVDNWPEWKDSVPQPVPQPPKEPDVTPLPPNAKKAFRDALRTFALAAQRAEPVWHYSQARPYTGLHAPAAEVHHDDCSAYLAILYYKAGRMSKHPVSDPLGFHYSGWGNTGTAYETLKTHKAPKDQYRIGDVALYLQPGGFGDHVTICIKNGSAQTSDWTSFGSEAGPMQLKLNYRSDLTGVYRHPALQ